MAYEQLVSVQNTATSGQVPKANGSGGYTWETPKAYYEKPSGGIPATDLAESYYLASNPSGYTSNNGTVTSVQVQATSPVQSSTSTAQSTSLNTTISLADGYGDTKNPYASKTKNYVLAAPSSANGVPSFRSLTEGDIPALGLSKISDFPYESLVGTNLLDNWYFPNAVNQRGQTTYSTAMAYCIDRWKLISGTATVTSDGLALNGKIAQTGQPYRSDVPMVATALLSDGTIVDADCSYTTDTQQNTYWVVEITCNNKTIVAMKLEVGTEQTLAYDSGGGVWKLCAMPNYAEQLERCQRYYYRLNVDAWETIALAYSSTTTNLSLTLPFPAMRKKPTMNAGHTFKVAGGGKTPNISSYSLRYSPNKRQIAIDLTPASGVTREVMHFVRCETNDSYWEFSAEDN